MKKVLILLLALFCFSATMQSQEVESKKKAKTEKKVKGNDGSTMEKAIVIKANNSFEGIQAEYEYIKKNFPDYQPKGQALLQEDKKIYDVLTIVNEKGEEKEVYFDITGFFGKY